jgi:hypothetical protein
MSYPPIRYETDTGEFSAVVRRADHEPEPTTPTGSVGYLATGASTGPDDTEMDEFYRRHDNIWL